MNVRFASTICFGLFLFALPWIGSIMPDVASAQTELPGARCACPDFSALVKGLSASVVNVSVEGSAARLEGESGEQEGSEGRKDGDSPLRSVGSGFIIDTGGLIVTNNHVIGNSDTAVVRLLDDKTEYPAKVVGKDPKTDLALIKIAPKGPLKAVRFGDSDLIEVGEWVVAIGNQFQLGQTVTAGIVSAKSRKVPTRAGPYDSFIQTDASINPGSSGGPLFNTKGEVVGINSAIFSPGRAPLGGSGFNIGIGFSIPINLAKSVFEQLKQKGRVTRGLLGVMIQQVDVTVSEALGLDSLDGALVADIVPNTPAAKAGFKRLDVIRRFGGHAVRDFDDLPILVASTPIGTTVDVEVIRNRAVEMLKVTIEEMKETLPEVKHAQIKFNAWGLALENLSPELSRSLGITGTHGVIVTSVQTGSVGERAGFMRGDIIEEVSGIATPDLSVLDRVVTGSPNDKPLLITVRRKEGTRILALRQPGQR